MPAGILSVSPSAIWPSVAQRLSRRHPGDLLRFIVATMHVSLAPVFKRCKPPATGNGGICTFASTLYQRPTGTSTEPLWHLCCLSVRRQTSAAILRSMSVHCTHSKQGSPSHTKSGMERWAGTSIKASQACNSDLLEILRYLPFPSKIFKSSLRMRRRYRRITPALSRQLTLWTLDMQSANPAF